MANFVFLPAMRDFHIGLHDWLNDTWKWMLLGAGYTPVRTHEFVSSVASVELDGTGYTSGFGNSGRKILSEPTQVISSPYVVHGCDAPQWPSLDLGDIAAIVLIKEVTNDADSNLILYIDQNLPITTDGTTFRIVIPETGLFRTLNIDDI